MKKIFISYAREDLEIAKQLYEDLKNNGFNPWMDKVDLLIGQDWKYEIRKIIQESSFFIALLSSNSVSKKGYVQKELKMALDILEEFPKSHIFLLPIRLDECHPLDEKLQNINWGELFTSYEEGVKQILHVLSLEEMTPESEQADTDSVLKSVDNEELNKDNQTETVETAETNILVRHQQDENHSPSLHSELIPPKKNSWHKRIYWTVGLITLSAVIVILLLWNLPIWTLNVETEPEGAAVFIDGEERGLSNLLLKGIRIGPVQIDVKLKGYETQTKKIQAKLGNNKVSFKLVLKEKAENQQKMSLKITCNVQDASVWINGKYFGTKRNFNISKPGQYHVQVKANGYQKFEKKVSVQSGKSMEMVAQLEKNIQKTIEPVPLKKADTSATKKPSSSSKPYTRKSSIDIQDILDQLRYYSNENDKLKMLERYREDLIGISFYDLKKLIRNFNDFIDYHAKLSALRLLLDCMSSELSPSQSKLSPSQIYAIKNEFNRSSGGQGEAERILLEYNSKY